MVSVRCLLVAALFVQVVEAQVPACPDVIEALTTKFWLVPLPVPLAAALDILADAALALAAAFVCLPIREDRPATA